MLDGTAFAASACCIAAGWAVVVVTLAVACEAPLADAVALVADTGCFVTNDGIELKLCSLLLFLSKGRDRGTRGPEDRKGWDGESSQKGDTITWRTRLMKHDAATKDFSEVDLASISDC